MIFRGPAQTLLCYHLLFSLGVVPCLYLEMRCVIAPFFMSFQTHNFHPSLSCFLVSLFTFHLRFSWPRSFYQWAQLFLHFQSSSLVWWSVSSVRFNSNSNTFCATECSFELFVFVSLELIGGMPSLKINHGSGTLVLQLTNNAGVADRRWHRLDVRSNSKVREECMCRNLTERLAG